jgi:hypothetical protein
VTGECYHTHVVKRPDGWRCQPCAKPFSPPVEEEVLREAVEGAEWALDVLALCMARLESLGETESIDAMYDSADRRARNAVARLKDFAGVDSRSPAIENKGPKS